MKIDLTSVLVCIFSLILGIIAGGFIYYKIAKLHTCNKVTTISADKPYTLKFKAIENKYINLEKINNSNLYSLSLSKNKYKFYYNINTLGLYRYFTNNISGVKINYQIYVPRTKSYEIYNILQLDIINNETMLFLYKDKSIGCFLVADPVSSNISKLCNIPYSFYQNIHLVNYAVIVVEDFCEPFNLF